MIAPVLDIFLRQKKVRRKAGGGRRDGYFATGPGLEPNNVWICPWL